IRPHAAGPPGLTSQEGTVTGQYALRADHLSHPIVTTRTEAQPNCGT
ncbi:hypothetical protein QK887_24840, partial [Salmonella enterica subsp. enterica serovar Oslo]|nr:hypothetical protein [Salmonella enterica subsp. enterica serovar Oslo]